MSAPTSNAVNTAHPVDGITTLRRNRRPVGRAQRNPWTSPASIGAFVILVVAFLAALFPGLFTNSDPYAGTDVALLHSSSEHWFGTDAVGRDLYARVVYGARQSLLGALIAVAVGLVVGTLLGLLAGSLRGWVDSVIMRVVDVLLSIPGILLSLSIIIVAGSDYIEAAYGAGATPAQVMARHILPNSLTPVIALATLQFGSAILQLSILGFLGYGAPAPTPEWGLIIAEGRDFMATAWWLIILPGLAIVAVVVSANRLSQNFRAEA